MNVFVQGASRGVGKGLAQHWLGAGASVVGTCRDPGAVTWDHPALTLLPLDLEQPASIDALTAAVGKRIDSLDRVYNVAGLLHDGPLRPARRLEELDAAGLQRLFAVNAAGPILVLKALLPFVRHQRRCLIVNVSARVGSIGDNRLGGWYGYRATKSAQNMFTKTAAIELKRRAPNAVVVAYHPGTVDTELSQPFQRGLPAGQLTTVDAAVEHLLRVTEPLEPTSSGSFLDWRGQAIVW